MIWVPWKVLYKCHLLLLLLLLLLFQMDLVWQWGWQKCDKLTSTPEELLPVIRCNCQSDCSTEVPVALTQYRHPVMRMKMTMNKLSLNAHIGQLVCLISSWSGISMSWLVVSLTSNLVCYFSRSSFLLLILLISPNENQCDMSKINSHHWYTVDFLFLYIYLFIFVCSRTRYSMAKCSMHNNVGL